MIRHPNRQHYFVIGPSLDKEYQNITGREKTCDLQNIEGKGRYGSHLLSFDGVDKVPTMQRRCQNNCEVEYQRVKRKEGQGADFGGEVCYEVGKVKQCISDYNALQTGTVCNPKPGEKDETTKYDEVTDEPAGDDGGKDSGGNDGSGKQDGRGKDGANNPGKEPKPGQGHQGDNNGGAGSGNAGGNQGGGPGGSGKDSAGDSGAADDPDKIKDDKKPGGGRPGRPGRPGKDGKDGKDADEKDSGSADDETDPKKPAEDGKDGSNGGSGNKGDHGGGHDGPGGNTGGTIGGSKGGAGGKDSDSGNPDGKGNGDTDGDGKGKGSGISGGDCKTNKAPVCKGDPVQCYIAKEQWRTACLAERGGGEVKGGSCKDNKPPECKGDATQCYIVKQQFYQGCEAARAQADRDSEQDYVNDNAKAIGEVAGSGMDDVAKGLEGNGKSIDLGSVLDLNGYGWSRTCPVIAPIDMGKWGKLEMDTSAMCVIAQIVGNIMVAMSLMFSVRYVFAGG